MSNMVSRIYTYLFFLMILYPFIFLYLFNSQASVAGVDLITYIGADLNRNIQFIVSFIIPFLGAFMWSLKDDIEAKKNVLITFIKMMTIAIVLVLLKQLGLAIVMFILIFLIYKDMDDLFEQLKSELSMSKLFSKEFGSIWGLLGIGLLVRIFLINKMR